MNPPKGSKPFDLLAALNGAPVVTRDGRKIVRLVYDNQPSPADKPLASHAKYGGTLATRKDGLHMSDGSESEHDLFMEERTKIGWLNLYRHNGKVNAGPVHGSRALAEAWSSDENYIKTVEVEIPVE